MFYLFHKKNGYVFRYRDAAVDQYTRKWSSLVLQFASRSEAEEFQTKSKLPQIGDAEIRFKQSTSLGLRSRRY